MSTVDDRWRRVGNWTWGLHEASKICITNIQVSKRVYYSWIHDRIEAKARLRRMSHAPAFTKNVFSPTMNHVDEPYTGIFYNGWPWLRETFSYLIDLRKKHPFQVHQFHQCTCWTLESPSGIANQSIISWWHFRLGGLHLREPEISVTVLQLERVYWANWVHNRRKHETAPYIKSCNRFLLRLNLSIELSHGSGGKDSCWFFGAMENLSLHIKLMYKLIFSVVATNQQQPLPLPSSVNPFIMQRLLKLQANTMPWYEGFYSFPFCGICAGPVYQWTARQHHAQTDFDHQLGPKLGALYWAPSSGPSCNQNRKGFRKAEAL